MKNLLKKIGIATAGLALVATMAVLPVSNVFAACDASDDCMGCTSSLEASKCAAKASDPDGGNGNLIASINDIINAVFIIMGIVAAAFIIMGGVSYATSQGDPSKAAKAKNTILYAIVGLIVCLLAFAIVNFVLDALA